MSNSEEISRQYQRVHNSKSFRNVNELYPFIDFTCKCRMSDDNKSLLLIVTCMSRKLMIRKKLSLATLERTRSVLLDDLLGDLITGTIAKIMKTIVLEEKVK
jgi:hypothetical protein